MFRSRITNINISCKSESTLLHDFSLTLQLVLRKKWGHQKTCWFTIGMLLNYTLDRWILPSGVHWKHCVVKRFNLNSVIEHLIHFPSWVASCSLSAERERTHSSSLIVIWSEQGILIGSVLQRVMFGSPPPSNANIPYVYCIDAPTDTWAQQKLPRKVSGFSPRIWNEVLWVGAGSARSDSLKVKLV